MEWTEKGEKRGEKQVCAKQSLPSFDPDKDGLMERKVMEPESWRKEGWGSNVLRIAHFFGLKVLGVMTEQEVLN